MRSLQSRTSAPSAELLTWLLLATATSAACGLAISRQATAIAVAIPAIALGAALLPLIGPGGFVGFALVAASNAIPGVDLTSYSVGQADGTDVAFAAILGFAVVRRLSAPAAARSHPVNRLLWIWAGLFLAIWALAFVRALNAGTDYAHAILTGRDYLCFALTLPFASSLIRNGRELRQFCVLVGVLSVSLGATYIVTAVGIASIANSPLTVAEGPLTRVYSSGYYVLELAFSFSCAYVLLHEGRWTRAASLVAVVTAGAIAVSLTRASYVGVVLALALGLAIWGMGPASAHRRLRRRLALIACLAAVLGAGLAATAPGALTSGPVHSVVTRASSISSEFSSSHPATSDLAYRVKLESVMAQTLGSRWPLGLGFLSPHTNYFADLPEGNIRNTDTGVFNALMTIGVVGTVVLYLAPLSLLAALLLRAHRRVGADGFLLMGGTIWLLIVLITSYSLGSLASMSGLATTAVGIGVLLYALASGAARTESRADPSPRARGE